MTHYDWHQWLIGLMLWPVGPIFLAAILLLTFWKGR